MEFKTVNPYNNEILKTYHSISDEVLEQKLEKSKKAFLSWRKVPLSERIDLMKKAATVLRDNSEQYARMITLEMGKPISESRSEIKKCALVCDYYANNAEEFLKDEIIESDAQLSFVRHEPIGGVFAVMPWNFPFWQVFRFAAPTLIAGNSGILKHASAVLGCGELIEEVFTKAGFPEGLFQSVIVNHDASEKIISHDAIHAISLTGSEKAGSSIASLAGKYIKKSVLELGGSNAFIVWEDADIDQAVETAVLARYLNTGQSCIAAKRFILVEGIYDEFVAKFTKAVSILKSGDPLLEDTQIGPMARKDLADQLQKQVQNSIELGAELLLGGNQKECYHEPTILGNVTSEMPAFKEETFGPLAAMIKAKDITDAFRLAEDSKFGLGATIFTTNTDKALELISEISDGAYFINELVKSDPRLPFGGTKTSGFGRELSKDGIMEFINRKTVYMK